MLINQVSLDDLKSKYLYANTPRYLFKHFRSSIPLQLLAIQNQPESLAREYNKIISPDIKSLENIVLAYAILVAFSFLEYSKVRDIYSSLDVTKLKWGEDIKSISMTTVKNWNFTTFQPDIPEVIHTPFESDSSTATASFDL